MVWETLPVIYQDGQYDRPAEALWPYLPAYSEGRLPTNKQGRLISTANARLRHEGAPFAPTFMGSWRSGFRVVVLSSWFYEFDSRIKPQVPYAVFPLDSPFWMMGGLARWTVLPDGTRRMTVAIITIEPNDVLCSVGHNRSPALFHRPDQAKTWLSGEPQEALALLAPHPNETMGVESVPMEIKIPGNQAVEMPAALNKR